MRVVSWSLNRRDVMMGKQSKREEEGRERGGWGNAMEGKEGNYMG